MKKIFALLVVLAASAFGAAAVSPVSVNTVTALRALAPGAYAVAELKGYATLGDGGGGVVNWVANSTKAANACSVYVPTSAPARGRWERPASPFRLARQCGIFTMDDTIAGNVTFASLSGSGSRMVVASATGLVSTQAIPSGGSLANPTGTIGLTAVNGSATSGLRSDGAPALSQAIIPTWTGKHTFSDTVAAALGIRSGTTGSSDVQLYRSAANKWETPDSLAVGGGVAVAGPIAVTGVATLSNLAGAGTRMVVVDASGVASTQSIPAGSSLANPTGTIGLTAVNGVLTSGLRSDGAPPLSQAIAPTWSATHTFSLAPIFSSVTANQFLNVNGSKALTSVGSTGSGVVMLDASPTTTGTLTGGNGSFSGTMLVAGVITNNQLTGTGNRVVTSNAAGGLSNTTSISGANTWADAQIFTSKVTGSDTVAAVLGFRAGNTGTSDVQLYRSAANRWFTPDSMTVAGSMTVTGADTVVGKVTAKGNIDVSGELGSGTVTIYANPTKPGDSNVELVTLDHVGSPVGFRINTNNSGTKAASGIGLYIKGVPALEIDTLRRLSAAYGATFSTKLTHDRTVMTQTVITSSSGNVAVDAALSDFYTLTLDENTTLSNPTNSEAGRHFTIRIKQDGTGNRTMSFDTNYRFPNGVIPVISTGGGSTDYLSFIYDEAASTWDFVGNALNLTSGS